mgnify:CR=1 FL=1
MGLLDTIKNSIDTLSKASNKTVSDYEKEGGPKLPKKAAVVKKTTVIAEPEDDMPATDASGKYLKPTVTTTMKKGGMVSSASKRADGCAIRGKTKGRMV